jgi:DNA-binding MurR/RpiR family transcriptional regulator
MDTPDYPVDVTRVISDRFASLAPKQQLVARRLLEDPVFATFASAADLAERAGVDAATVVRTCQALGYTGWRQLQEAVRDGEATRGTFADRMAALEAPDDGDLAGRVFATALDNVSGTFAELDRAVLDGAVAAVARAGGVLIVGGGVVQGPALFLMTSLQLLGCRATLATTAPDAGPALGALSAGDAVIGLSVWRYLRSTTRTLELAAEAGVTTIAITDSPLSSAGLVADHVLVARTSTVGPRLGLAGITTLTEALVAGVALADPERAIAATRRADALYAASGVLEQSDPDAVPPQPRGTAMTDPVDSRRTKES